MLKPPGSVSPPTPPVAGPPTTPPSQPPSQTGKPPEQPPGTTAPPPVTSTPPETPVIIFVKATQSVLEGQPQGRGLPGYNTALFAPKPELPFFDDGTQTAQQDLGFDQDPVKCTTGQGGECKLTLDTAAQTEFGIVRQLDFSKPWGSNYRIDVSVPQTTGGVLEITGLGGNDVIRLDTLRSGLPDQVTIFPDIFNVGDRSFLRIGLDQPFGLNFDPEGHFNKLFGDPKLFNKPVIYLIDFCRDKQPGPPLGAPAASFVALSQALPATVRLRHSILDRLRQLP